MQLFVNARFLTQPISGVQRYSIDMSRQIRRLWPHTVFLAPKNILHHDIANELGAEIMGKNTGHLWEQTSLPSFLQKQGSPPLFNSGNTAPLFYSNNFITIHDLAFRLFPHWNSKAFAVWYNFLIPKTAKNARHIFTVSETVKKELQHNLRLPAQKISVAYNGLSPSLAAMRDTRIAKGKIILAVGSFNERKNHHKLIEAFLQSSIAGAYELVIVGGRQRIFNQEKPLATSPFVTMLQDADDVVLAKKYNEAEVVVSLSSYEGFGIPVLEGLFFGCKALCSDIDVYRELFESKAYFCNPSDIMDISAKLEEIISKPYPATIADIVGRYDYQTSAQIILETIATASQNRPA